MRWVALVAAKDAAASIEATVEALAALRGVGEVWVVDDGSTDATASVAASAGARVVRLDKNLGKGGALAQGLRATPHAERYLLADADLGATAAGLQRLIDTHEMGGASLVVGVLPAAGGRGGFGAVKRLAAAGIRRACALRLTAPISGQRAVDGATLRGLVLADRFGVEVAMTIDVARHGATVVEVPVEVDHHHTGRSFAGFAHRARQGRDIARALIPRVSSVRQRCAAVVAAGVAAVLALSAISVLAAPSRGSDLPRSTRVVLFAFDHLGLADLERDLPGVRGLLADGSAGALSVRTTDRRSLDRRAGPERPSLIDAYASLGASARVRSTPGLASAPLTSTGLAPSAMRAARALARRDRAPSLPGALGAQLHEAGKRTAFVGGARLEAPGRAGFPGAVAVADQRGRIDTVSLAPGMLESAASTTGVRASIPAFGRAVATAMRDNHVVLVDPGETARALDGGADRLDALRRTDAILAGIRGVLPPGATLVVFAPTPPGVDWELTPLIVYNATTRGTLASSSTRRASMAVLSDIAPTVLSLVGVEPSRAMTGATLRAAQGSLDASRFERLSADGAARSRFFLGASVGYTVAALAFYLLLLGAFAIGAVDARRRVLRAATVATAAFPLALLVNAATQHWGGVGGESPLVLVGMCLGLAAIVSRLRGVAPLYWFAAAVVVLVVVDVAVTGPLHTASLLGYSLQTTGRFYGLPNASFAVFASNLVVLAAAAAGGLRRATPARAFAGCSVLAVGLVFVGAPWLGNDVGGTLALAPVAAALGWKFAGRNFSLPVVALGAVAVGSVLVVVLGIEAVVGEGTHLGRALGGDASLTSTLTQRGENNLGLLVDQWWGFLVLGLAVGGLGAMYRGRGQRELPVGTPMRAALAAALALSLMAFAVNDSGPVVAVLCLVVATPVLALRAIDAYPRRLSGR